MDRAVMVRDGTALLADRPGPVRILDRSARYMDPFPDLYWRAWGHAIPPRLEMDPCGEIWEDVIEEKGEQVRSEGLDGASPPEGGRRKSAALRRRATRRVQALGWSSLGDGIGE